MGSMFWRIPFTDKGNPLETGSQSDWGMHPSLLWQQQGGKVLPGTSWTGQAPSLQGAQAGYTPASYVKAAGSFLNPATQPSYGS